MRNITYLIRILKLLAVYTFLPVEKRAGYLVKSLQSLGPSFVKFGQALSVRADIVGEELAENLSSLQDNMPPFDSQKAVNIIEKELGRKLETIFAEFSHIPVAAASIAQVHKARTLDGCDVAVKILRPGIEKKFKYDLALFYSVARIIGLFPSCRRLRPREVVDVFAQSVKKELDLRMEAAACAQLFENCKDDKYFKVPKVSWEYTGRRVLVTDWVDGIPINNREELQKSGHDLQEISKRLAVAFLNQSFRDGFFHADIHPGNLFVDREGNIVPVDFGIMGVLDRPTRIYVAQILRGFITGDYMHVAKIHFEAGWVPGDKSVYDFALACRAIGQPIMGLAARDVSIAKLLALLFKITEDFNMRTQPQLLLLQKSMMLIEGVGQQLYPQVNLWQLAEGWIKEWGQENLGLKACVKESLQEVLSVLKNLPERLRQIDEIIEKKAKSKEFV